MVGGAYWYHINDKNDVKRKDRTQQESQEIDAEEFKKPSITVMENIKIIS
jgi:hypothetical protein